MEHGPRLVLANTETLKDCIVCNQSISPKDQKEIRSGATRIGYRHSRCSIPQYIKDKYPSAR